MLRNKDHTAVLGVLDTVMARNPEWIATYGDRIADAEISSDIKASAKEKDDLLTEAAISESEAIQFAWDGDFVAATAALAETADKAAIADARLAGWHNLWLGWFYQLAGDAQAASAEYARARSRLGSAVYLPSQSVSSVSGGKKVTVRGSRMFNLVSEEHVSRFDKEVGILTKRFIPLGKSDSTSAQHEEAVRALGEALGFVSSRPDNMFHTGPDVLWVDEEEKSCLLFELKTLQGGDKPITKKITGQGHDHIQWVKDQHPGLNIVGLIFVAETEVCNADANPSADMWVGSLEAVRELGSAFITEIKSIRFSLPLERLYKVESFVGDVQNSVEGILKKIASVRLNVE